MDDETLPNFIKEKHTHPPTWSFYLCWGSRVLKLFSPPSEL
jgi:hypothetical protein